MPLDPQQKQKLKMVLEEALKDLEEDKIHVGVTMFNGMSSWYGNTFSVLGWICYIKEVVLGTMIIASAPEPSKILTPVKGGHC